MRSTRVRWLTALAAVACGLFAVMPSPAAAATHRPVKHNAPHPTGFFITGEGRIVTGTNSTALLRDSSGGEHVVTSVRSASTSGDHGHLVYLTRARGASKWVSHAIPGLRPMAGGIQVEIHTSYYGERVFAVFYECDGVFVSDASLTQSRLPEPTLVQTRDNCASPPKAPAGPIQDAVAIPGGSDEISVLLPDPDQSNQEMLYTGVPGKTFMPQYPLPTDNSFTPVRMTIDAQTGLISVVGNGSDGTNAGIYATTKAWYDSTWSTLTRIAGLKQPSKDFAIQSITADDGAIWVGLFKPVVAGLHRSNALYVVHGSSGQWFGAIALAHSTTQDTGLVLTYNTATGHLHAAFTRVDTASKTKKSGIITEARVNGKWTSVKYMTHWYRDRATQITYTTAGHAVIGYEQS